MIQSDRKKKRRYGWLGAAICLALGGCNSKPSDLASGTISKGNDRNPTKSLTAPAPQPKTEPVPLDEFQQSHERMLTTLKAVDKQSQLDHPFLGVRPLKMAELALKTSGPSASAWDKSVMHGLYGQQLLRAGRTKEALEQMQTSTDLVDSLGDSIPLKVKQQIYYLLGVAYLRDAETINCVHCINGERCLFPVSGEGVHEDKSSSMGAIRYFEKALELAPGDLKARWLLNVAYMTIGEHPSKVPAQYLIDPTKFSGGQSPVGEFTNKAKELNVNIKGCAGGVIIDDFDGDLDLDVVFSTWETNGSLRYLVNNGDNTFRDETEQANLSGILGGLNLVQADYDNDGDIDILVLRGAWLENHGRHPKSLLRNDGKGHFLDVTYAVGLGNEMFPTQTASWADFDHDGDLDLYVGHEGFPSQLFQNDGAGRFKDIAPAAGVVNGLPTKGVAWGDYDGDSWPDIYVSNLGGRNSLYRNQRDGTFVDMATELKVDGPYYSFPIWFWDANNDGFLDLYVSSYKPGVEHVVRDYLGQADENEPDAFYFGTPDGKFEERRESLGFSRVTQPMGINAGDIDNDGFLDMYLGTGYVDYEGLIPNLMFHNQQGKKLVDITFSARVGHLQKGHGVAFADFDHDGDVDIFAVMGGWFTGDAFARAAFVNPGTDNHWLYVRLVGTESNRFGVGCRVRATLKNSDETKRNVYRWMDSGGSFGANPLRIHLGLGSNETIEELEVFWPKTGKSQILKDIPANQFIEITEGSEGWRSLKY
ncbi:MAG: CRTAC1 family protein [Pirellula sp.]